MRPLVRGTFFALAAAVAFGVTTPLIQRAGRGAGPFATAFSLYAGAAVFSSFGALRRRKSSLGARDFPRLGLIAILGAALAPTLFAWGLQRSSALGASLLLNLEVVFTALLALFFFRERLGRRVLLAVALMALGGLVTVGSSVAGARMGGPLAAVAIVGAVLAWALDNTLTRPLADRDVSEVVATKASCGAAVTLPLSLAAGEPWPRPLLLMGLLGCGAVGYGASLQLYVLAQRHLGAARTASMFACAPFVGALAAWLLGDRAGGASLVFASSLFGLGAWLHFGERHGHGHVHHALEHDHIHDHDDGHHDHLHEVYPDGGHAHWHRHAELEHTHEHGEDLHHRHEHTRGRALLEED
jgi:drug/metabolite transporter (DMT)-like permease